MQLPLTGKSHFVRRWVGGAAGGAHTRGRATITLVYIEDSSLEIIAAASSRIASSLEIMTALSIKFIYLIWTIYITVQLLTSNIQFSNFGI